MTEVDVELIGNPVANDTITKKSGMDVPDAQETIRRKVRMSAEDIVREGLVSK